MNAILSLSKLKKIISKIALKHGVSAVWLFGSYARNEAKEHSDVDLLIEKGNVKTMIQLISFQQDLEKHLGIKVDVVTTESIKYDYFILKELERDAFSLYDVNLSNGKTFTDLMKNCYNEDYNPYMLDMMQADK